MSSRGEDVYASQGCCVLFETAGHFNTRTDDLQPNKMITIAFSLSLCGLGVLGIGVWIRIDMVQFDELLGKSMVPIAAYVLIAAGGIVMLISLVGCLGALKEHRVLLGLYFTFMLFIFMMEGAAAVMGALFYDQAKPFLSTYVETAMMTKYGDPNYELVTKSVDKLQQEFECCGFDEPEDWDNATSFTGATVPVSCCRNQNQPSCNTAYNSTNIYDQGCVDALSDWMTGNLIYLLGVAIAVALFQFFTFVLIAFGCEVFSTVKSFLVYDKVSSSIEMRLEYSMKYQYHYNTEHSDVINSIQRELNCCGLHKYSDWQYYRYYRDVSLAVARGRETVPISCCRDTAGTLCNVGYKVPRDLTKIYTKILGMVLCCCFYKAMKDTRR
ncbi:CD151 [Mytilus coruscus]|uniref:CD151 n=1 Tax=Mytilus coruscus TaxID=42192 RepID=A0A6J8DSD6_MYTCO|nr:CD151 [Mytilus coruscus]